MNKLIGLLLLCFAAGALLPASASADIQSLKSGFWSDPATWSTGTVPGTGDNVLIDSGHVVVYDHYSEENIRLIHIRGELTFSRETSTLLDAGMIILTNRKTINENLDCSIHQGNSAWPNAPRPALEVGTADNPMPRGVSATIRLTYFADMDPECAPGIISYGGRMDFHGAPLNHSWVKIGTSVSAGARQVILEKAVNWQVGDLIIITRSNRPEGNIVKEKSFRVNGQIQTEERRIREISGKRITLDRPLEFSHPRRGDRTGEVAVLSRNVTVTSKDPAGERGHTMYHYESRGSISYAEFSHLGKAGLLARYPIHFHVVRSSMRGGSVIGASIWDSHNRFVTIHGTDYLVVRDCVGYQSLGNGFFMEDGTEVYNLLENNLAVQAFATDKLPNQALPFDKNDGAGFWWANGRNAFINNVATECDTYGFLFDIRDDVFLNVPGPDGKMDRNVPVHRIPFLRVAGNEVHNTMKYGFRGRGKGAADHPFIIEDLKIWGLWYAIRPDFDGFWIKGLDIRNVAYGFYAYHPKNARVENYTAVRSGNEAMSFRRTPEGIITFEHVKIDSTNEYPIKLYGKDERRAPAEIHLRDYAITNVKEGRYGVGSSDEAEAHPSLTMVLHDWFGTGRDARVIPAEQRRNDGYDYQPLRPVFDKYTKVARTDNTFPEYSVTLNDREPPASVILTPRTEQQVPTDGGNITVIGTCIDASPVASLTVNGVAAEALTADYRRWKVVLKNVRHGKLVLRTDAVDIHGNREINPHVVEVFVKKGGDEGAQAAVGGEYRRH